MKNKALAIHLMISIVLLSSCIGFINEGITGNGNVKTEMREIGSFHEIDVSSGLNVYVTFGDEGNQVEVVADENLHEYIEVYVSGGTLNIKSRKNIRRASSRDVYVQAGEIDEIEVSSAADLTGENTLVTEDIDINVSSAGDLQLDLEATSVYAGVSSSGSLKLSGSAISLDADVSSAGTLKAGNLVVEECDIDVSSAGDAWVNATKDLNASASSAGSVRYQGNPEDKRINTSSAGSVSGD